MYLISDLGKFSKVQASSGKFKQVQQVQASSGKFRKVQVNSGNFR